MASVLLANMPFLVVMLVLLLCSAFFSASETALFSLTQEDLRTMAAKPSRSGRRIVQLLGDAHTLLAAVLFGNMLVNISIYGLGFLVAWDLAEVSHAQAAAWTLGTLLAVILFGEVSPKGIAVGRAVPIAHLVAEPVYWFYRATRPVSNLLHRISESTTNRLSRHFTPAPYVTRDELKMLMGMAEQQGALDARTRSMIEQVVELAEMRAKEVMTPRVDVPRFNLADGRAAFCYAILRGRHRRVVAYEGTTENVPGVLFSRDVFLHPEKTLKELVRPVQFVPETQTLERLLQALGRDSQSVAIVVDEYGGMAGLVTLEHVLEEVIGEFGARAGGPEQVEQLDEDTYLVAGDLGAREWPQLLGAAFDRPGVETVGGFVMSLLGRVPKVGERIVWRGLEFTVERMSGRRVQRVRVHRLKNGEGA